MKKILFYNITLILFSLVLEEVIIINNNNNKKIVDVDKDILSFLKDGKQIENYYEKIYAFNPQNCKQRNNIPQGYHSCYMSLKYGDNYYYFCGRIKDDIYNKTKDLDKNFIEKLQYKDQIKKRKDLKIDCYNEKIVYIKYFLLLLIILI